MIYRHVDILNEAGLDSTVVHQRAGFSCQWFAHQTKITNAKAVRLTPDDLLVIPEIYGPFLEHLPTNVRKIAFNQNTYLTYDGTKPGKRISYEMFEAAMVVSKDNAEYLKFAYPELERISVVTNGVDPKIFCPSKEAPPKRIALMPRKRPCDAHQVLHLLGKRLDGWDVVRISGQSEQETARLMRSSAIFLAFGQQEGFGLPPAEAMACGCYVIGFPGFGGREIFRSAFSQPIEDGDILAFAQAIAEVTWRFEQSPAAVRAEGLQASDYIRQEYSLERQRCDLLNFFNTLIS